jgi:hypothetical protein
VRLGGHHSAVPRRSMEPVDGPIGWARSESANLETYPGKPRQAETFGGSGLNLGSRGRNGRRSARLVRFRGEPHRLRRAVHARAPTETNGSRVARSPPSPLTPARRSAREPAARSWFVAWRRRTPMMRGASSTSGAGAPAARAGQQFALSGQVSPNPVTPSAVVRWTTVLDNATTAPPDMRYSPWTYVGRMRRGRPARWSSPPRAPRWLRRWSSDWRPRRASRSVSAVVVRSGCGPPVRGCAGPHLDTPAYSSSAMSRGAIASRCRRRFLSHVA